MLPATLFLQLIPLFPPCAINHQVQYLYRYAELIVNLKTRAGKEEDYKTLEKALAKAGMMPPGTGVGTVTQGRQMERVARFVSGVLKKGWPGGWVGVGMHACVHAWVAEWVLVGGRALGGGAGVGGAHFIDRSHQEEA